MNVKMRTLITSGIVIIFITLIVLYRHNINSTQNLTDTTPVPIPTENVVTNISPATPTIQPTRPVTTAIDSKNAFDLGFQPGTVLTNDARNRIYFITADGTARRLESWMTFYALGFQTDAAITVENSTLDQIPLSGHLTQHLRDDNGYHYWATSGHLWAIDNWQGLLAAPNFRGIPATPVDPLSIDGLPIIKTVPNNILMRDGVKMYVRQGGEAHPVTSSSVYQAFGYTFNQAVDIPHGVMSRYDHLPPLTRFLQGEDKIYEIVEGQRRPITLEKIIDTGYSRNDVCTVGNSFLRSFPLVDDAVILETTSPVVNLRQGPGTGQTVLNQVSAGEKLTALGRTPDHSWFKVRYQGNSVWIAANVVEAKGNVDNLPTIDTLIVYATPTRPQATATPLSPIVCRDVPIRGFGRVWSDHVEIQHQLDCPQTDEQATQAAVQKFEHGLMVWLSPDVGGADEAIYIFFNDHTYQRSPVISTTDSEKINTIPAGFYSIGDRFSGVYQQATGIRVKERLGQAISPQQDTAGAFQKFGKGHMLWFEVLDQIFALDNMPPTWQSFEDTF